MQIDKNKLKNFLNLNDEDFRRAISEAAKAGGVADDKMANVLKDVQNVKKTLGSLNEQDIVNAVNSFGGDNLEALMKNIKNNSKQ